jgi:membrane-associated phospholipid phosphatase
VLERTLRHASRSGRGVEITELLSAEATWPVVVSFALLSQLGDVWFYFLLGSVCYVAGAKAASLGLDRRRGLSVLGLVLTYVSLVGVMKNVFGLDRPPGATTPPGSVVGPAVLQRVFESVTTASGSGFPSGHALGAAMVWGGLALLVDRWSLRTRGAVAALLVTVISVSRLVLGVHYLVDVVVGVALGVVTLLVCYRLSAAGTRPGRLLGAAAVLGLVGVAQRVTFDSVAALGAAVGGWVAWRLVAAAVRSQPSDRRAVVAGLAVLCVASVLFVVVYTVEPPLPLAFLGAALTVGAVVAAPLAGE